LIYSHRLWLVMDPIILSNIMWNQYSISAAT